MIPDPLLVVRMRRIGMRIPVRTLALRWSNGSGAANAVATLGFWTAAASRGILVGLSSSLPAPLAQMANQPLTIAQDTANPTLGDGTLTATVVYTTVAVS